MTDNVNSILLERILQTLETILIELRTPANEHGYPVTPTGVPLCPKHHAEMPEREKQGDKWNSHATPLGYCRGHRGKNSPGWEWDGDDDDSPPPPAPKPAPPQPKRGKPLPDSELDNFFGPPASSKAPPPPDAISPDNPIPAGDDSTTIAQPTGSTQYQAYQLLAKKALQNGLDPEVYATIDGKLHKHRSVPRATRELCKAVGWPMPG